MAPPTQTRLDVSASPAFVKTYGELVFALERNRRLARRKRLARNPLRPVARRLRLLPPPSEQEDFLQGLPRTSPLHAALSKIPANFITNWSLTADSAQWLYDEIMAAQFSTIVELGCGVSTLMLAVAARELGIRVISLEENEHWLAQTAGALGVSGLLDSVELIHAPLTPVTFDGREYRAHDDSRLNGVEPDLLLIDAPPRTVGRMGTLPRMAARLRPDATIILDDASRSGENECVKAWVRNGLAKFEGFLALGHGMALLTRKQD